MAMEWTFSALLPVRRHISSSAIPRLIGLMLCTLLAGTRVLQAQEIIWSQPAKNERSLERVRVVASSQTIMHVIEEREGQLRWLRYTTDSLRIKSSADIAGPSEDFTVEHFFIHTDTLTLIYSGWNKESDQTEIFIRRFIADGEPVGESKLVHARFENSKPKKSGIECVLSPDSLSMLLFFDSDVERKQTEGISFKCYNHSLQLLWEKELRLPATPDLLQVHHFLLDNKAGVYMMSGRNPIKTFADWQRPQGGQYVVYYYEPYGKRLKQYDIGLKDKQVISVEFALNSKQEVVIAGYYSNNFKFKAAGTLYFTIQAFGGSMKKAAYTPFTEEFIEEITVGGKETLEDFYLDYLYLHPDGRAILVGEQYYVSRYVSTDPTTGRQMVEYRYNFDDIMVNCLDTGATHAWNLRIPKRQFTNAPSDRNFSYAFDPAPAGLSITFNDDNASTDRLNSKEDFQASLWTGSKNSVTTFCYVGMDGIQHRSTLVDNNAERLLFNPLIVSSAPIGQAIFGFDDNRTYKFCRRR